MSLYVLPVPTFTNTFYGAPRDAVSLRNGQLGFREWQVLDLPNLIFGQLGVRAATGVRLLRHRFKVLRVHATGVAAQVINDQPRRNRPDCLLVEEPMSVLIPADSAVPKCGLAAGPVPASRIRINGVPGFNRTLSRSGTGDAVGAGLAASRAVRNGLAAVKTSFGRMKGHDRLQSVVPRRRVFLAPLRLSVGSIIPAEGAL